MAKLQQSLLLAAALLFSAIDLLAQNRDSITLIDNRTMSGTVTATSSSVAVTDGNGTTTRFNWKDIKSIQLHNKVIQLSPSGSASISDETLQVFDNGTTFELVSGRMPIAAIKSIVDTAVTTCPPDVQFLLDKFNLGAAILSATQHQQTYSGGVTVATNWRSTGSPANCGSLKQRTLVDLLPSYDEKKSGKAVPVITREYGATVQQLAFLSTDYSKYAYGLASLYHNNSLGLYLQQNYGAGFGAKYGHFEADGDLRFVGEHFYSPGVSRQLVGAGLKASYDIPIGGKGADLNFTETFVPVFNQSKAWYSNVFASLNILFKPKWSMSVMMFDNYLRNAPDTFRRNYLKLTIGITYKPVSK